MGLFEKRVTIYKKKDRATWEQIKDVLRKNGVRGVRAGHYFRDAVSPNGIGGMVDPRDFGAKGKIDRDIYFVEVKASMADKALQVIHDAGIMAVVESDVEKDAAEKISDEIE